MAAPSKNTLRRLFMWYSHALVTGLKLLDLLPPEPRGLLLRAMLGSCGRNVFIDYGVYLRFPRRIFIGNEVTVGRGCLFLPSHFVPEATITIGDNVRIGPETAFLAAGHDHRHLHLPDNGAPVEVGGNVWIGARATLLPGASIGEGAVVAAGAVVRGRVEPWTMVGGVPARPMGTREVNQP